MTFVEDPDDPQHWCDGGGTVWHRCHHPDTDHACRCDLDADHTADDYDRALNWC